jgi:Cu/Ag efflux pump CusA
VTATLLTLLVLPALYPWFRGHRSTAARQPASRVLSAAQ